MSSTVTRPWPAGPQGPVYRYPRTSDRCSQRGSVLYGWPLWRNRDDSNRAGPQLVDDPVCADVLERKPLSRPLRAYPTSPPGLVSGHGDEDGCRSPTPGDGDVLASLRHFSATSLSIASCRRNFARDGLGYELWRSPTRTRAALLADESRRLAEAFGRTRRTRRGRQRREVVNAGWRPGRSATGDSAGTACSLQPCNRAGDCDVLRQ